MPLDDVVAQPLRAGVDLTSFYAAPDDVFRYTLDGEAYPRLVIRATLTSAEVIVGPGTIYPNVPLGGGSLPTAGTTGQALVKASATNFDVTWSFPARFIHYRVVDSRTSCVADLALAGAIEVPYAGAITDIGAYVDTAGVTGLMTVDVNLNGTSIMAGTKITLDSGETSSRTAAAAPVITTSTVAVGDLLTVDVDAVQATPAKGLVVRFGIQQTP